MKVSSWVGLHLHLDIHCLILSKVSSTAVMQSLLRNLEMLSVPVDTPSLGSLRQCCSQLPGLRGHGLSSPDAKEDSFHRQIERLSIRHRSLCDTLPPS